MENFKDGNLLIREYDGWKFVKMVGAEKDLCLYQRFDDEGKLIHDGVYHEIQYQDNWNLLIGVVEKIRKSGRMVNINFWSDQFTTECKIYDRGLGSDEITTEDENSSKAVFDAIVEFIKKYVKAENMHVSP